MDMPSTVQKYFWDVESAFLDPKEQGFFIAERILEHGDPPAISWLTKSISKPVLLSVVQKSRSLSDKSRHYWSLVWNMPIHSRVCTKKPLDKTPQTPWRSLPGRHS
ncbi:MAG: hypothetical protein AAB932_05340 [Patescibacteria group bacterium]